MSAPRARVVQADGTVIEVLYDALQVDDTLVLHTGDELPADGVVLDAKGLEVNESMLTGESAAVDKAPGDTIYAATTVVAGTAHARVTAVGSATKAGAISTVLKQYAPQPTPLQRAIQRAITVFTILRGCRRSASSRRLLPQRSQSCQRGCSWRARSYLLLAHCA